MVDYKIFYQIIEFKSKSQIFYSINIYMDIRLGLIGLCIFLIFFLCNKNCNNNIIISISIILLILMYYLIQDKEYFGMHSDEQLTVADLGTPNEINFTAIKGPAHINSVQKDMSGKIDNLEDKINFMQSIIDKKTDAINNSRFATYKQIPVVSSCVKLNADGTSAMDGYSFDREANRQDSPLINQSSLTKSDFNKIRELI